MWLYSTFQESILTEFSAKSAIPFFVLFKIFTEYIYFKDLSKNKIAAFVKFLSSLEPKRFFFTWISLTLLQSVADWV